MKKIVVVFFVSFAFVSCTPPGTFTIEKHTVDESLHLQHLVTHNNWVKTDQGKYIEFDFTIVQEQDTEKKDYYLVLSEFSRDLKKHFSIGQKLILTINDSYQITLHLATLKSTGSFTTLSHGYSKHSVCIRAEDFKRLVHANSIRFLLQGSLSSQITEVTGSFSEQNLANLKQMQNL